MEPFGEDVTERRWYRPARRAATRSPSGTPVVTGARPPYFGGTANRKGRPHAAVRAPHRRKIVRHRTVHLGRRRQARLPGRGHHAQPRRRRAAAGRGRRGRGGARRPPARRHRSGVDHDLRRRGGGRPRAPRRRGQQRRCGAHRDHRERVPRRRPPGDGGQLLRRGGRDRGSDTPPPRLARADRDRHQRGRRGGTTLQRGLLRGEVRGRGVHGEHGAGGRVPRCRRRPRRCRPRTRSPRR